MKGKTLLLALILSFALTGCKGAEAALAIRVPEGASGFAYSQGEVLSHSGTVVLLAGQEVGDTLISLLPTDDTKPPEPTYITPGLEVKLEVEKDKWYKVGVDVGKSHKAADLIIKVRADVVRIP